MILENFNRSALKQWVKTSGSTFGLSSPFLSIGGYTYSIYYNKLYWYLEGSVTPPTPFMFLWDSAEVASFSGYQRAFLTLEGPKVSDSFSPVVDAVVSVVNWSAHQDASSIYQQYKICVDGFRKEREELEKTTLVSDMESILFSHMKAKNSLLPLMPDKGTQGIIETFAKIQSFLGVKKPTSFLQKYRQEVKAKYFHPPISYKELGDRIESFYEKF